MKGDIRLNLIIVTDMSVPLIKVPYLQFTIKTNYVECRQLHSFNVLNAINNEYINRNNIVKWKRENYM